MVGSGDFNGDMLLSDGTTVVQWSMQNGAYLSGNTVATGLAGGLPELAKKRPGFDHDGSLGG